MLKDLFYESTCLTDLNQNLVDYLCYIFKDHQELNWLMGDVQAKYLKLKRD